MKFKQIISSLVFVVSCVLAANLSHADGFIAGCRVFPSDNPWNRDVSTDPVDSNSMNFISNMTSRTSKNLHPDFGADYNGPFGIPYILVSSNQAPAQINVVAYPEDSDPGPYPIPPNAPIEGGANSDGDRHVLVVETNSCMLYELFNAFKVSDTQWNCDSAAKFDLKTNVMRPLGWTSADAAGLPILPGLVRYDEVASGAINHALRFTVSKSQMAYVYPARHYASSITDPNYAPMGLRVRLKANYDISGYTGQARVILTALKKYGMIVADNGSDWYISGAPDSRWDDNNLNTLKNVPGSAFEVVKRGYYPTTQVNDTLAGGLYHTVAIKDDGSVWSWGNNVYGSLGDGTYSNRFTPTQILPAGKGRQVAAGNYHSIMVDDKNAAWSWGKGTYGQLGLNSTSTKNKPTKIPTLASNVVMVTAGQSHAAALKADGTVWTWGRNQLGQLGDATVSNHLSPICISAFSNVVEISSRGDHTLALKADGTVWAWGYNAYGQLGIGNSNMVLSPVLVSNLNQVVSISAGKNHSVALKSDGSVWAWGYNASGQLGDGTTTRRFLPVRSSVSNVVAITSGFDFNLARRVDGSVYGWGYNGYGQLGTSNTVSQKIPVPVNINGSVELSAGAYHSMSLASDGTLFCWGLDNFGQLGNGTTNNAVLPGRVSNLDLITVP